MSAGSHLVLDRGGVKLHLARGGRLGREDAPDHRPKLLFLHGYPEDHSIWSHQLAALEGGFDVAALDLRGCGRSSPPPPGRAGYAFDDVLADIDAAVDAIAAAGAPIHLIGHDWGAMLGWKFVSDAGRAARLASFVALSGPHPDLVRRFIASELRRGARGWATVLGQARKSYYVGLFQFPGVAEAMWRRGGRDLWRRILKAGGVPSDDPILDTPEPIVLGNAIRPLALYRNFARDLVAGTPEPLISLPCLQLIGLHDVAIHPRIYTPLDGAVPNLTRRELPCNHFAQRQRPDLITDAIRQFVSEVAPA